MLLAIQKTKAKVAGMKIFQHYLAQPRKEVFFKIPNDLTVRPHRTARGAIWVSNRGEGEDNGWVITSVRD